MSTWVQIIKILNSNQHDLFKVPPEKMAKLRPVFRPDVGTVTGGNSSFFTDGASACLIGEENYVKAKDLPCRAYLREWVFVAQDPKDELLLGPAYAIPKGFRGDNFISGNH